MVVPKLQTSHATHPSNPSKLLQALKFRDGYTEVDLLEGVRLVKEERKTLTYAAECINDIKKSPVPRMTLSDRLKRIDMGFMNQPKLGRQQVRYGAVPVW